MAPARERMYRDQDNNNNIKYRSDIFVLVYMLSICANTKKAFFIEHNVEKDACSNLEMVKMLLVIKFKQREKMLWTE